MNTIHRNGLVYSKHNQRRVQYSVLTRGKLKKFTFLTHYSKFPLVVKAGIYITIACITMYIIIVQIIKYEKYP